MNTKASPRARVLIVEDDSTICEIISDMLEGTAIEAVCVHSDQAAYVTLPTAPWFRAIVLDVNLGEGTTGFDVARFARQMIPDIAVIYISGDASEQSVQAFGVPGGAFLQKPFSTDELLNELQARIAA